MGADLLQGRAYQQTQEGRGTKKNRDQGPLSAGQEIFTVTEYNFDTLAQRLRELAFLNKGLLITLTDERPPIQDRRSQARTSSSTTAASPSSSST
jgi:DNA gyrase/topoisomerase IV subunit B